jgi:hypothetical protein
MHFGNRRRLRYARKTAKAAMSFGSTNLFNKKGTQSTGTGKLVSYTEIPVDESVSKLV